MIKKHALLLVTEKRCKHRNPNQKIPDNANGPFGPSPKVKINKNPNTENGIFPIDTIPKVKRNRNPCKGRGSRIKKGPKD